jgi:hypothetical protein
MNARHVIEVATTNAPAWRTATSHETKRRMPMMPLRKFVGS